MNWTIIKTLLPLRDENKRNYYINLCIEHNLSKRELITALKDKSYERLIHEPDKIIINTSSNKSNDIRENPKNPILIKLNKEEKILKESNLQVVILARLKNFFTELGTGYAFIGSEYKIKYEGIIRYIDLLFFNIEHNCYVVVELKLRSLEEKDKGQILMYISLVDKTLKRGFHNKTIGIIITKEQDKFIASFVSEESIIPITYKITNLT